MWAIEMILKEVRLVGFVQIWPQVHVRDVDNHVLIFYDEYSRTMMMMMMMNQRMMMSGVYEFLVHFFLGDVFYAFSSTHSHNLWQIAPQAMD